MVNYEVHYNEIPERWKLMMLPDGMMDVWVTKNVQNKVVVDEDGNHYTDYFAEEAYARLPFEPEIDVTNFEEMFDFIANWEPETPISLEDDVDTTIRQIRADVDYIAMEIGIDL